MNKGINAFTIKIAGVPVKIQCMYQENYNFFLSYLTSEEWAFCVEVTEGDLLFSQSLLQKSYGNSEYNSPGWLLENISIQNVLSKKLLDYNVLMLHGSALCMDGEAYIFIAPSGTGKSTHSRFWREKFGDRVWMINDDKPFVRVESKNVTVYGTPWDGKHHLSRNASAPLKAIIWLTRSNNNQIKKMEKADAFPILLRQTAWSRTGPLKPHIMGLEKSLLDSVEFYKLDCNTDPEAAFIAWKGMRKK